MPITITSLVHGYHFETKTLVKVVGGRGGGIQISSDKDDQRIFWGLRFLIPGFFGVVKYGKYFLGWLVSVK